MIGSIYVGLSGLQAHSEGLQQVSNNVTNLNALGFKASTISFSDVHQSRDSGGISLQSNAGMVGDGGTGGGVSVGIAQIDFSPGELRRTGRDLDLAIDGSGFLVLQNGDDVRYARTGSFIIDEDGYVALSGTDWRLSTLDSSGGTAAVSIAASRTDPPEKTTRISFADNLSSSATSYQVGNLSVFSAAGEEFIWQIAFSREEGATDWTVAVSDANGRAIGEQILAFSGGAPSDATKVLTFQDANNDLSVDFDFSDNVTAFSSGSVSTLRAAAIDGHGVGAVSTFAINADGLLELAYTNGETKELGAVAIASFRNPQDLVQQSAGLFVAGASADVALHASTDSRVGTAVSGRLESSNVDLAREFGQMILIQRGFQASSQVISVANDMVQQLFSIRGQG